MPATFFASANSDHRSIVYTCLQSARPQWPSSIPGAEIAENRLSFHPMHSMAQRSQQCRAPPGIAVNWDVDPNEGPRRPPAAHAIAHGVLGRLAERSQPTFFSSGLGAGYAIFARMEGRPLIPCALCHQKQLMNSPITQTRAPDRTNFRSIIAHVRPRYRPCPGKLLHHTRSAVCCRCPTRICGLLASPPRFDPHALKICVAVSTVSM